MECKSWDWKFCCIDRKVCFWASLIWVLFGSNCLCWLLWVFGGFWVFFLNIFFCVVLFIFVNCCWFKFCISCMCNCSFFLVMFFLILCLEKKGFSLVTGWIMVGMLWGCLFSEVVVIGWIIYVGVVDTFCCCRLLLVLVGGTLDFFVFRLGRWEEIFCILVVLIIDMFCFLVELFVFVRRGFILILVKCLLVFCIRWEWVFVIIDFSMFVEDIVFSIYVVVGKDLLVFLVKFMFIFFFVIIRFSWVLDMCVGIFLLLLVSCGNVIVICIFSLFVIVLIIEDWVDMGEEDIVGVVGIRWFIVFLFWRFVRNFIKWNKEK